MSKFVIANPRQVAAQLRALADRIEAGEDEKDIETIRIVAKAGGDPWAGPIADYALNKEVVTVPEVLEQALGIASGSRSEQMRVAKILRAQGFVKSKKKVNGRLRCLWRPVALRIDAADPTRRHGSGSA